MGFGDEIIATYEAHQLKGNHPSAQVIIRGWHGLMDWTPNQQEVFENNPDITQREELDRFQPMLVVDNYLGKRPYLKAIRRRRMLFREFQVRPGVISLRPEEQALSDEYRRRYDDYVVLAPSVKKTDAHDNKDWEYGGAFPQRWNQLASKLSGRCSLVVLHPVGHAIRQLDNASVVSTRSFRQTCCLLAGSRGVICPEGGIHHATAALGRPAVVLFGGRVSPACLGYDGHVNLYVGSRRSPCGSVDRCRHCRECMRKLTVNVVFEGACRAFRLTDGADGQLIGGVVEADHD